ncbi:MAG: hypothetical protein V1920_00740 [Bacillota bacterium]
MGKQTMNLFELQKEVNEWSQNNFPRTLPYQPLLGITEEVGELYHAHLKNEQGIRTNENHQAAKFDAVGDIVIYLADCCNQNRINLDLAVTKTWGEVKLRDWQENKVNGTN